MLEAATDPNSVRADDGVALANVRFLREPQNSRACGATYKIPTTTVTQFPDYLVEIEGSLSLPFGNVEEKIRSVREGECVDRAEPRNCSLDFLVRNQGDIRLLVRVKAKRKAASTFQ